MSEAETGRKGDWIQLRTGKPFWPLDPRPEEIELEDIAHALGNICRFTGHVRWFYSVGEHSVRVSKACDPADALWGLLHDASEAYLVDVARPVKRLPEMAAYREAEDRLQRAICARFGLPQDQPASVTHADRVLLATEKRDLMGSGPRWEGWPDPLAESIVSMGPVHAQEAFMARWVELGGRT